jgi:hypothetical protein
MIHMNPRVMTMLYPFTSFLKFCAKVRRDDPSILPEPREPLRIRHLSQNEHMEFADTLLENTKSSAEAMAKYRRTSKRLQRIRRKGNLYLC